MRGRPTAGLESHFGSWIPASAASLVTRPFLLPVCNSSLTSSPAMWIHQSPTSTYWPAPDSDRGPNVWSTNVKRSENQTLPPCNLPEPVSTTERFSFASKSVETSSPQTEVLTMLMEVKRNLVQKITSRISEYTLPLL